MMIFEGPCSPRFTADTLVVSVNVGEGGPAPGEALGFPCEFVVNVNGRRGRDLCIGERGFGLVAGEGEREERGWMYSRSLWVEIGAFASGGLKWRPVRGTLRALRLPRMAQCKSTRIEADKHSLSM